MFQVIPTYEVRWAADKMLKVPLDDLQAVVSAIVRSYPTATIEIWPPKSPVVSQVAVNSGYGGGA